MEVSNSTLPWINLRSSVHLLKDVDSSRAKQEQWPGNRDNNTVYFPDLWVDCSWMTHTTWHNFTCWDKMYEEDLLVLSRDFFAHFYYCQQKMTVLPLITSDLGKDDIKNISHKALWSIKVHTVLRVCRPVIWVS